MLYFNSSLSCVKDDNHRPIKPTPNQTVTWYEKQQHCRQLSHTNCEVLGYHEGTKWRSRSSEIQRALDLGGYADPKINVTNLPHKTTISGLWSTRTNYIEMRTVCSFCYLYHCSFTFLLLLLQLPDQIPCTFSNISNKSYGGKTLSPSTSRSSRLSSYALCRKMCFSGYSLSLPVMTSCELKFV